MIVLSLLVVNWKLFDVMKITEAISSKGLLSMPALLIPIHRVALHFPTRYHWCHFGSSLATNKQKNKTKGIARQRWADRQDTEMREEETQNVVTQVLLEIYWFALCLTPESQWEIVQMISFVSLVQSIPSHRDPDVQCPNFMAVFLITDTSLPEYSDWPSVSCTHTIHAPKKWRNGTGTKGYPEFISP